MLDTKTSKHEYTKVKESFSGKIKTFSLNRISVSTYLKKQNDLSHI